MEMVDKMDAGDVYYQEELIIDKEDNCTTLFNKMSELIQKMIIKVLPLYINNELKPIPQDENLVTFASSIKPEEEHLDLNKDVNIIHGYIRALSDTPGAYLLLNNLKYKIFSSRIVNDLAEGEIGQIIKADKNGLIIQCLNGQLQILEIQKEGKKRMDYKSFLNGNNNLLGKKFI